ncbi:MAG: uroporphyrinogen decarboxylase family protein, partial [Thermodesulfobacteriota bacterium]
MGENAARLYNEREKRVADIIELRRPDRVPIIPHFNFFPATYAGVTVAELMYDPDKIGESYWRVLQDFEPDMIENPYGKLMGPVLDALDCKQARWPGRNLPANVPFQFIEQEYMKAEEFDAFLSDPSDFIVRQLWPRIFGALKGLEKLPPLHNVISYSVGMGTAFGSPEVAEALDALRRVSEESIKAVTYMRSFAQMSKEKGFPMDSDSMTQAPFDLLADFFRGSRGIMLDMYRRPEILLKACEKVLPFLLERALLPARASGNPRVMIPLHKGTDGSLSREQYLRFYWPTLRELMLALIKEGMVPCPFFEGEYTSRLDIIKDMPPGKACYKFESMDMAKAREVLGDGIALRGGVPVSLLVTSTPDRVREHVKRLIETVGKRGGLIIDVSTNLNDARPENVRALFDAAREYGV